MYSVIILPRQSLYRGTVDFVCPCFKLLTRGAVCGQNCWPVSFIMGLRSVGQGRVGRAAGIDRSQRGIFHPSTQTLPATKQPPSLAMQVQPLIVPY